MAEEEPLELTTVTAELLMLELLGAELLPGVKGLIALPGLLAVAGDSLLLALRASMVRGDALGDGTTGGGGGI